MAEHPIEISAEPAFGDVPAITWAWCYTCDRSVESVFAIGPAADLEIEAAAFQHMEDAAKHDDGETCNNPYCEDCEHPMTEWDRAQPLIDDMRGK